MILMHYQVLKSNHDIVLVVIFHDRLTCTTGPTCWFVVVPPEGQSGKTTWMEATPGIGYILDGSKVEHFTTFELDPSELVTSSVAHTQVTRAHGTVTVADRQVLRDHLARKGLTLGFCLSVHDTSKRKCSDRDEEGEDEEMDEEEGHADSD